MMRDIKFRAWDKQENIMHDVECVYVEPSGSGKDITVKSKDEEGVLEWLSLDDAELMQFTGLRDKNGMGIYEGDVVLDKYEEVKIVQWYEGQFVVTRQVLNGSGQRFEYNNINNHINHYSKFEVIGNIYEHPEILGDNQ